jgi:tetratricopeptide (TPR) repeat protein
VTEPASRTPPPLGPCRFALDLAAHRPADASAEAAAHPPPPALPVAEPRAHPSPPALPLVRPDADPAAERWLDRAPRASGILALGLPVGEETHPGASDLHALEAHLSGRQRATLRHLLKCPPCLRVLLAAAESDAEHASGVARLALALRGLSRAPRAPIDLRLERDRDAAPALLAALLTDEADRERLVRSEPRFGSPGLAELLLAEAADDTRNHPRQACAYARLALAVAARIDRGRFGAAVADALAAEAWARLAGALWHAAELAAAAEALHTAAAAAEALPPGTVARAVYCQAAASIRAGEGRTDEALRLLLQAAAVCQEPREGEPLREGLSRLGDVLADLGCLLVDFDAAAALTPLAKALDLLDPAQSPWSALRVRQALALALAELGDREAACRMLDYCRDLAREGLEHPLDQLRYLRAEAGILERLGQGRQALDLLRTLAGGFAEERHGFDAALVLVDAAELLLGLPRRRGELASLRGLAAKLAKLLPAKPLLALTVTLRIVHRGEVSAPHLLAHVRDYLRAVRRDPDRPYAPSRRPHGAVLWTCLSDDDRREICRQVAIPEAVASCADREIGPELRDRIGWTYQELTGLEIRWGAGLPSENVPVPRAPGGDER